MRGFLIFRGDLISQIGVENEVFEKAKALNKNFPESRITRVIFFGIHRARRCVLQYQKLNLNFDKIENSVDCI